MAIRTVRSTSCCRGPTDLKTSELWPENDAYAVVAGGFPELWRDCLAGQVSGGKWNRKASRMTAYAAIRPSIRTMTQLSMRAPLREGLDPSLDPNPSRLDEPAWTR